MTLTYGAMFAGYGGLEIAVQSVLGGETRWHAEFEAAPSKILARHWPDVPNLGDVTKIDWRDAEPVDVITGGSPCQDLSHAGKRKGMTDGTRSNLWAEMREAVAVIRPRLVVWENVRGALSACADSDMGRCPRCVDERHPGGHAPYLRALGRVVGDLAELGYDARWYGLRAADVGAAHGRFRIFLFAQPADADLSGLEGLGDQAGTSPAGRHGHVEPSAGRPDLTLLPTPTTSEGNGAGCHGTGALDLRTTVAQLLPTPRATDGTKGGPNQRGSSGDLMLPSAVGRLLPTPTSSDAAASGAYGYNGNEFCTLTDATVRREQDWREYEAAIRRQEHAFGRPAPAPTEPGRNGKPRLSPAFVEWLMGLPEGHVTDVPDVSRNDQLKALGNGVVPQQAAAATRAFIHDARTEAA